MAGHRVRTTILVIVTTLLVAPVVAFTGAMAAVFWSGCFLECSEPDHGSAIAAGAVALVFCGIPVVVGFASARGSRRLILWATVTGVVLVAGTVLGSQLVGIA